MPYLVSLVVLAGMIFALVDIITRDQSLVKHMPKTVWLFVVILLPFLGTVLWFAIGREYPRREVSRPPQFAPLGERTHPAAGARARGPLDRAAAR